MDKLKLIDEIEASAYNLCGIYSASSMAEFNNEDGLSWFSTSIPSPVFNSVFNTNINSDTMDDKIKKIKSYYNSKSLPVLWWVGPSTRPRDIDKHLEKYGFKQMSNMPGMAADLNSLSNNIPLPEGLVIELVDNREKLERWAHAAGRGFGIPEKIVASILALELSIGFDIPWKRYTAIYNNVPVGTSGLLLGNNTAGIFNVSVDPDYRGKGIGSAITLKPLQDARSSGYNFGVLQSSPMGFSIYKKLGFQEYCKISQYSWRSKD